jgi:hypothetical protein
MSCHVKSSSFSKTNRAAIDVSRCSFRSCLVSLYLVYALPSILCLPQVFANALVCFSSNLDANYFRPPVFFTSSLCANPSENNQVPGFINGFHPPSHPLHVRPTFQTILRPQCEPLNILHFKNTLTRTLHRESSPSINPSTLILRQINELSEAIENTKILMANAKQAMCHVERSLCESYQLIKRLNMVRLCDSPCFHHVE